MTGGHGPRRWICLAAAPSLFLAAMPAQAEAPLLADVFSDHAVLQQGVSIPVWGRGRPGERVTVVLAGARASAVVAADGRWSLALPAMRAGGPHRLQVRSSTGAGQALDDVLVGEVWLCSGQSNMEWPVRSSANAAAEIAAADFPRLRLLQVQRHDAPAPAETLVGAPEWRPASPASVADFSAACYFFGRALQAARRVPVGLIHASWGGSVARAWLSPGALAALGTYAEPLALMALRAEAPDRAAARWDAGMEAWWRARDPGIVSDPRWSSPQLDDSPWPRLSAPGHWEASGVEPLRDFDGVVWLRRTIDLPSEAAGRAATLALGRIDNWDSVWVNGALVGEDRTWSNERRYRVPAGVLRAGRNLIAVRVLDSGANGGLLGGEAFALEVDAGPRVALAGQWAYRIAAPLASLGPVPAVPWVGGASTGALYNGMIAPLMPYAIRGVAWYQGESDRGDPVEYARLLPALFGDWRRGFGRKLDFLVVQLAGFAAPGAAPFVQIREVQRRAVARDPAAALIVTTDIGDAASIHPLDKQEVGRRLALAARRLSYGEPIVAAGPRPRRIRRGEGQVIIRFDADGPLRTRGGEPLIGAELCDADGACHAVAAELIGKQMVLRRPGEVKRVRFAWHEFPTSFLTDRSGLPAAPFDEPVD